MPNAFMSMLKKGIDDVQRVAFGLWPRWNGWGWGRVRMLLPSARFDWEEEAGDPWRNSTVALGLAWLGDRFPRPRVSLSRIARNGDHIPVDRNPIIDLWNMPNPYYTRRTMEKAIGLSLKCDGNAYIQKIRDRAGRVVQLWWIPHFRCNPTWPSDGSEYIGGYRIRVDGRNFYHIPAEDVIHIRDGIDPWNERIGLSALKSTLREVVTLNLASGYAAALMKNSGVPGIVFVPKGSNPPRPDKDMADRIKERFGEEFSGDLVGSPLVAAGQYDIIKLGFSPEEMSLDKLPRDAEARVAASIGVAAMSLGLPDPNKTYANLGEANRSSWGTVVSIQELIAESVQYQLLPERINVPTGTSQGLDPHAYCFEYDYQHIQELQESLDAVHARVREDWKAGMIRLNEAREETGREPDLEGDRYFPGTGSQADADMMERQAALKQSQPGEEPEEEGGKALSIMGGRPFDLAFCGVDEKRNYSRDSDGQFARTGGGKKPGKNPEKPGHSGSGGGGGSGARHKPTAKEKADRVKKGKPLEYASEKARRAAEHQNKTDGRVQEYTKNNEHVFAGRMGGKSFPDNDPADVEMEIKGRTHGIELKTITHGTNDKVTMKASAIARKVEWEKEHGTQMHTVVLDHRDKKVGGTDAAHLHSGHEIYYKRGVGSFRIGQMYKVKDEAELKSLMATRYDKLPAAAQGPKRGTVH